MMKHHMGFFTVITVIHNSFTNSGDANEHMLMHISLTTIYSNSSNTNTISAHARQSGS